jgi:nucleoside-diphosphate-sugar epimerase
MKVVIFGATGMLGMGVLLECLAESGYRQQILRSEDINQLALRRSFS